MVDCLHQTGWVTVSANDCCTAFTQKTVAPLASPKFVFCHRTHPVPSQMYMSSVAYTTAPPSSWTSMSAVSTCPASGSSLLLAASATGTAVPKAAATAGAAAFRRASATACLLARSSACRHPHLRRLPWQPLPSRAVSGPEHHHKQPRVFRAPIAGTS